MVSCGALYGNKGCTLNYAYYDFAYAYNNPIVTAEYYPYVSGINGASNECTVDSATMNQYGVVNTTGDGLDGYITVNSRVNS